MTKITDKDCLFEKLVNFLQLRRKTLLIIWSSLFFLLVLDRHYFLNYSFQTRSHKSARVHWISSLYQLTLPFDQGDEKQLAGAGTWNEMKPALKVKSRSFSAPCFWRVIQKHEKFLLILIFEIKLSNIIVVHYLLFSKSSDFF